MKHLSFAGLDVTRLGLGLMGMSGVYTGHGADEAESIRTIRRAIDLGVTFFDTAEAYGPYRNEELLAQAVVNRRQLALTRLRQQTAADSMQSTMASQSAVKTRGD